MYGKILFITPPVGLSQGRVRKPPSSYHPLHFGFLSASAREAGVRADLLDGYTLALSGEKVLDEIRKRNPDVIGLSGTTASIKSSYTLSRLIRENNIDAKIILGGVHVTSLYMDMLGEKSRGPEGVRTRLFREELDTNPTIDHIFIGEADHTLKRFLSGEIKGRVIVSDPVSDLDALSIPAYDLFLPFHFFNPSPHLSGGNIMPMVTSRGCAYNCDYCSVSETQGRRYRYRSARSVVDEIAYLKEKESVRSISFREGDFTSNRNRLLDFCRLLREEKMGITWNCNAHINHLTPGMVSEMRKSGCMNVQVGIEFGNDERRARFKGGNVTNDKIRDVIELCKNAGISVHAYSLFGMEGETKAYMRDTIRFAREIDTDSAVFAVAIPQPSTRFYNRCIDRNAIRTFDWNQYDVPDRDIYEPGQVRLKVIKRYARRAGWAFYMRPKKMFGFLKAVKSPGDLFHFFRLFNKYLLGVK